MKDSNTRNRKISLDSLHRSLPPFRGKGFLRNAGSLLAIIIGALLVTSCAKPTTQIPQHDEADIAEEDALHQSLLHQQTVEARRYKMLSNEKAVEKLDRVAPRIRAEGDRICRAMLGNKVDRCDYKVALTGGKEVNAYADGDKIYITRPMVSFAGTDEELAMVLAHEYAHNILDHPGSQTQNAIAGALVGALFDIAASSQGMNTNGEIARMAAQAGVVAYSPEFEQEADYVSLYILANAGYNTRKTVDFWRRMTLHDPNGMYGSVTHPSNPKRTVIIRETIAEIAAKRKRKETLLPEMKKPEPEEAL